jgi:TetR/AcrR family transcriptional repressor of bet genes
MARKKSKTVATARTARARHRQHLIDACISALHLYGPSKTTVDKVVAIAGLSPGIVRFYFDSKDAMLVASLEFLANEFEQRLLLPVTQHIDDPVVALNLLVELYLGPELASTRKVSVWYSFWGEASSRQEYYDICGARDAKFEALVYDLTRGLLEREPVSNAEPDAIALGLIGTLEMLWQGYAFQTESGIDRGSAKRRVESYLRSVFPSSFGRREASTGIIRSETSGWMFAGRVQDLAQTGAVVTVDAPGERLMVIRGEDDILRAFANRCPSRPHALVHDAPPRPLARIECRTHGLAFTLTGMPLNASKERLAPRACLTVGDFLWIATGNAPASPSPAFASQCETGALRAPVVTELNVQADWMVLMELWQRPDHTAEAEVPPGRVPGWSQDRFAALTAGLPASRQTWIAPGQWLDQGPAGLTVTSIRPLRPGESTVRQWRYDLQSDTQQTRVLRYLLTRNFHLSLTVAAAMQRGLDTDAMAKTLGSRRV